MRVKEASQGFSLIELMVVVGVIGIIAAISFPLYQDYVITARTSVMADNIQTIKIMETDRRLRLGEYVEGTYDPADPGATGGLTDVLEWAPGTESDKVTYVVACGTDATSPECARSSGVSVTATHADGGEVVVSF